MIKLTAKIEKEQETNLYVSYCPQVDIASQGNTIGEAMDNLKEAVSLYLEEVTESHHRELVLA